MNGFRHIIPIEVRFRDLDALGHVNNATYLTYAETARVKYLVDVGLVTFPIRSWQSLNLILAHLSCNYIKPIQLGQQVMIGSRVREMKRSSFHLQYRIEADGELAAEGHAVMVYYDYAAQQSQPIPADIRTTIETFENGANHST